MAGVLLILCLPFLLYLLDLSLQGPDGFREAAGWLQTAGVKLIAACIAWALFHHLFAGIRFLLLDTGIGIELARARRSAWLVNIAGAIAALVFAGYLL